MYVRLPAFADLLPTGDASTYYCQGDHLATFGRTLVGEPISAWDKGPVVESLWRDQRDGLTPTPIDDEPDNDDLNTIGYVVSRYGNMSGTDLERLPRRSALA